MSEEFAHEREHIRLSRVDEMSAADPMPDPGFVFNQGEQSNKRPDRWCLSLKLRHYRLIFWGISTANSKSATDSARCPCEPAAERRVLEATWVRPPTV